MNKWNLAMLAIAVTAILLCLLIVFLERRKTKRTLKLLNHMLDCALDGSFTEDTFDESLLSAVESRLNQYLISSAVSARNLSTEKEKIKELLSDISHQTKTPIANILLYTQLLGEQNLPETSRACVLSLEAQAEKLSFLIASLVKLSRLETGVLTLNPVSQKITQMLEEAVEQYAPKAAQKGIQLTLDSSDAGAVFDYKWTTEALCNLLDNAVKYTPAGGGIRVSAREYDLFCRIDVADTGMGIAEAELAKVFLRFYRSSTVGEQEGVGIGLYLTRQILAGQGGYIKVTSTPGKGSVFSMFLPR